MILDLRKLETIADYFVICTGDVDQQVRAIVDNIEKQVRSATGERVMHREGQDTLNWVLLDFVDVVVHVFKPSFREFYRLEDLWGDAEMIPVEDGTEAAAKPRTVRKRVVAAKAEIEKAPAKRTSAKKKAAGAKTAAKSARKSAAKKTTKAAPAKKASASKRPRKTTT